MKAFLPIFAEQMVVDIVGDAKIVDLKDVFVEQGFSVYEQLYRMNRIGTLEFKEIDTPNVCFAEDVDAQVVLDMLHSYFDPLSDSCPVMRKYCILYRRRAFLYIRKQVRCMDSLSLN